ncbi:MAG: NADH-quinone oxidoreductase subunit I [Actinomycetota bacterium]
MSAPRSSSGKRLRSAVPGLGLFKGMWLTLRTFLRKPPTIMYPLEKEIPLPRARGVIALDAEACTVCMLCARDCPDWCIYIEGHKEQRPPAEPGGRARTRSVLDRFDIDFALCMYCGTCVEVCPFDALFWSPEYEYSAESVADLRHDKARLGEWLATVPEPPALEGSEP